MRIRKVKLEKFRSFDKEEFNFYDITSIVGQNNSGKSGILKGLNTFFNPKTELDNFIKGNHLYTTRRSTPKIEVVFDNIPNKAVYNEKVFNAQLTLRFSYSTTTKTYKYSYKNGNQYIDLNDTFIDELKEDIRFVLIPTIRDYKDAIALEESLLKRLLISYLSVHTARRDTLSPKVSNAVDYVSKNALKKVSKDIKKYYSNRHEFEFDITHNKDIDYGLLLDNLSISITESGNKFRLRECGSGIQSLVIIAMYHYLAELHHNNIILGIEEPEINLHPQSQTEFLKSLKEAASSSNIQIIFSTHSSTFINHLEHHEIVLIRKVEDTTRGFKSCIYQVPQNFWQTNNLVQLNYQQFYKYRSGDFFFARLVIVVESPTDVEVLKYYLKRNNIDTDLEGISFLELDGIRSIKYPFHLLKQLNIPTLFVVDKDFFIPYFTNNEKENSRRGNGFFYYRQQYKNEPIINEMIPTQTERNTLLPLLNSNHSRALVILQRRNIICMKYNLEMDLLASRNAQTIAYDYLNVQNPNRNPRYLLTNMKKKIKKLDVLFEIIDNIDNRNYPNSFKRFLRIMKEKIKK